MTKVAIRVDASVGMGTGHLRRCLSLAQALIDLGASVRLVCRLLDDVAPDLLRKLLCDVCWLPAPIAYAVDDDDADGLPLHHAWAQVPWRVDALQTCAALSAFEPDWLLVDHYAFDARWHTQVSSRLACQLAVLDDLADRQIAADILIDHNWADSHSAKYADALALSTKNTRILGGPNFALLSAAYLNTAPYKFHSEVCSIGIFMGGTDPGRISEQVLDICRHEFGFTGPVEVVSTSVNPHLTSLRLACGKSPNTTLTLDQPHLADFFARHDLHIGAGGGATWERCCMGVPSIVLVLQANQLAVVPALVRLGVLKAAVMTTSPESDSDGLNGFAQPLAQVLRHLVQHPDIRYQLSVNAARLVDGQGAERVALTLLGACLHLRPARLDDAAMLFAWRNHPQIRAVSIQTEPIAWEQHLRWIHSVLPDANRVLLVAEIASRAIGCIRFDLTDMMSATVSLYLDPSLQGLGLGRRMLLTGEQELLARAGEVLLIKAQVSENNLASQQMFVSCGYRGGPQFFQKTIHAYS